MRLYKYKVVLFDPIWDYIQFDSTVVPREVHALNNLGLSTKESPEYSHPGILLSPSLLLTHPSSASCPPAGPDPSLSSRLQGPSVADTICSSFKIQGNSHYLGQSPAKQTLLSGILWAPVPSPRPRDSRSAHPSAIRIPPARLATLTSQWSESGSWRAPHTPRTESQVSGPWPQSRRLWGFQLGLSSKHHQASCIVRTFHHSSRLSPSSFLSSLSSFSFPFSPLLNDRQASSTSTYPSHAEPKGFLFQTCRVATKRSPCFFSVPILLQLPLSNFSVFRTTSWIKSQDSINTHRPWYTLFNSSFLFHEQEGIWASRLFSHTSHKTPCCPLSNQTKPGGNDVPKAGAPQPRVWQGQVKLLSAGRWQTVSYPARLAT